MAQFHYRALKGDGSLAKGEIDATDRGEATRKLERQGLQPVKIEVGGSALGAGAGGGGAKKGGLAGWFGSGKSASGEGAEGEEELPTGPVKLKRAEIVLFTEELADLLGAGLQLEPALKTMENREELGQLKVLTRRLREQVRDGTSFSQALRSTSPSFGDLYCNLAQAGEVSGALGTILRRQAEYLVTMQDLQAKVVTALIYPAFLVTFSVVVGVMFMTFLIPQLTDMIESMGGELPGGAQFVIGAGDFLKSYWWAIIAVILIVVFGFRWWTRQEEYRPTWDRIRLKLPLVGSVISSRFYVQFLETLANLVANGLPLLRGLELARNATTNLYLKDVLGKVVDFVAEGGAMSRGLKKVGIFPPLLIDMVAVGEQTGDIAKSLQKAAERYDKELGVRIEKVGALVQPVVIVLMAVMVGTMAYFMITVIFETISTVRNRGT
ncbi:MAG: type II secretion system F family protein [Verrucomicrobiota bacterium]